MSRCPAPGLNALQTFAAELASPLPLARIAAVVGEAAMDLLDAEIVVVAVHVDDPRHLRGVHIAGIPRDGHDRLSAAPCDEASLVTEIDRLLGSNGASRSLGAARRTADPAGRVPSRPDGGRPGGGPALLRG